ncbi:hypothetical protein Rsub_08124 [Raphidocelis subcapitata]|uniref:Transmembrane protein 65 n=1 Tax=Raphidocelis subcapitata TaxID=307507 RepID=A0A2V0P4S3_9CHLO|nr:hypothetical protein Rsub_08124 [Raphidocelis subcapitata]|eukprot:GBF94881.1 hypothetical protein Rsub_08124 [Raphidocelis subcapitata]
MLGSARVLLGAALVGSVGGRVYSSGSSSSGSSGSSSGSSGTADAGAAPLHGPGRGSRARPYSSGPGPAPANGLSESQREALSHLVLQSFRRDAAGAASVLQRALDEGGRRELLAALGAAHGEAPPLSRRAGRGRASAVLSPEDAAAAAAGPGPGPGPGSDAAAAAAATASAPPAAPSLRQLAWVAVSRGIPFVAFGFCDNIIMITAGEQIDLAFGAKLGLSSMAAAGLGNCVADVVGINISHSIEQRTKRSPFLSSGLSAAQAKLPATQRAKWLGCGFGMAIGCLLGLVPLLFIDAEGTHQQALSKGSRQRPAPE